MPDWLSSKRHQSIVSLITHGENCFHRWSTLVMGVPSTKKVTLYSPSSFSDTHQYKLLFLLVHVQNLCALKQCSCLWYMHLELIIPTTFITIVQGSYCQWGKSHLFMNERFYTMTKINTIDIITHDEGWHTRPYCWSSSATLYNLNHLWLDPTILVN